ncbi:ADP-ribosylglycohydrolase family protein [Acetatifactor aquisgranensis]|uniref:ADP-ribosylglycohydrolase family protein n=1 Tax=Acetatifactor aquisgranensis TaxID=2941233 RepID=UPI0020403D44|nr:ADP-ribosylglycohydrolase family protein [Acetatifactor aquisgranensis]
MELNSKVLYDKIMGCWNGKNIGGVLGAPLEGRRGVFDVQFYLQEDMDGNPPPNDDLDLQLVWLAAAEKYGQQLTPEILGEYWLTFITPHWNEYGRGKGNMTGGLVPPLSGHVENTYHNSCGCFIRSEIWACLCPGNPDLAVKYAYRDGVVDHSEDGLYGELFCAALESAAFAESDRDTLVEIGLSYIPEDCLVATAVKLAQECFRQGLTWQEARKRMMQEVPGTFGIQGSTDGNTEGFPTSPAGNDAPNNIGLMMIGWLYGENDFGKSLCIAAGCGEDTDCTAGTLGAILGIIQGNARLPEEWLRPINDKINTLCIEKTKAHLLGGIPGTVTELSDRIAQAIPRFLYRDMCELLPEGGYRVFSQGNLFCTARNANFVPGIGGVGFSHDRNPVFHEKFSPMTIRRDHHMFRLYLEHPQGVFLRNGEELALRLTVEATAFCCQQWMNIRIYAPDFLTVRPGKSLSLPLHNTLQTPAVVDLTLAAADGLCDGMPAGEADVLIEVSLAGRHSYEVIKTRLYIR